MTNGVPLFFIGPAAAWPPTLSSKVTSPKAPFMAGSITWSYCGLIRSMPPASDMSMAGMKPMASARILTTSGLVHQ